MKPLRSTAPPTSILSTEFQYIPAAQTDLRATFARIKRERAKEQQQDGQSAQVVTINNRSKKA